MMASRGSLEFFPVVRPAAFVKIFLFVSLSQEIPVIAAVTRWKGGSESG